MLAIEQARVEVLMRNEIWALVPAREGYHFARLNIVEEWEPMQERPFHAITLNPNIQLRSRQIGKEKSTSAASSNEFELIIIFPNGEISPFEIALQLQQQNESMFLVSDGIARVQVIQQRQDLQEDLTR